jgi:hypothetical protein
MRIYVNQTNGENFIWDNCCNTACELAEIVGVSASGVKTTVHEGLNFSKVTYRTLGSNPVIQPTKGKMS